MEILRVDPSNIGILLIDAQPAFMEYAFPNHGEVEEALLIRLEHLLLLIDWLDVPVIATFEKPITENGELPERLEEVYPANGQRYVKNTFDCTSEQKIREAIEQSLPRQIAVAGAETDVCIMQSVLGLLQMGYHVFLLEDCLFTSEPHPGLALRRMYQAGAIPCTLKSMAYELVECVDNIPWYPEAWIMGDHPSTKPFPEKFISPEEWPPWEPKL